jgi:hypothetical protein
MSTNQHLLAENERSSEAHHEDDTSRGFVSSNNEVAFVERLPQALSYAANLRRGDHAILFYDNLVVAAEYFCAYICEGINRAETTCFIGLPREHYQRLFEQVGVRVVQLENCGYLSHFSIQDFYLENQRLNKNKALLNIEKLLRNSKESDGKAIRLIHIQKSLMEGDGPFRDLIEFEHWLKTLSPYPVSMICAYDAKMLVDDAPAKLFTDLLRAHGHCLFQGIAMPTSALLRTPNRQLPERIVSGYASIIARILSSIGCRLTVQDR